MGDTGEGLRPLSRRERGRGEGTFSGEGAWVVTHFRKSQ